MTDKYVVTSRANTTRAVYHTKEDCPRITDSAIRETTEHEIQHFELEECSFCKGENGGMHEIETEWHKINRKLRQTE